MKFARFARTFCWNVGTFGANLCKLFPDLRIQHSKVGQETSKLGARMNRFDRKMIDCLQNNFCLTKSSVERGDCGRKLSPQSSSTVLPVNFQSVSDKNYGYFVHRYHF